MEQKNILLQHILVTLFLMLLVVGVGSIIVDIRTETLKFEKHLEVAKEMRSEVATLIEENKEAMLFIAITLANDTTLHTALLQERSQDIDLQLFVERLKANTSLQHIQFHIVERNMRSFYRSWTRKKGDDLSKVRPDLVAMLQEPRASSVISVGIYDITFKAMVPIYYEDTLIGVVEAISKMSSLVKKIESRAMSSLIVVDKSYKEQLAFPFTQTFIADYYIATQNPDPRLMKQLSSSNIRQFLENETFVLLDSLSMLATTYRVLDVKNEDMGYILLFKELAEINYENVTRDQNQLILLFIILYIIALGLYYYFYIQRHSAIIQNMNIQLESLVEEKTKTLQYLAHHDSLTGLPNRLLFLDRLSHSIKQAKRHHTPLHLLFLDLDRFKEVNDSIGHEAGDMLLKEITKRLKESLREEDTIARLGGDEFTILLNDVVPSEVHKILYKILSLTQEPIYINETPTYTTFSIGISRYPNDGATPEILLRNADTAMYRAKELGKNRFQFYDASMTLDTQERFKKDSNLRLALDRGELEPFFQPQIDAVTKKIIGAEALIRWRDPVVGMVSPAHFIPLAEETGFITALDYFMMQRSFALCKELKNQGVFDGKLSLNLSVKQLEKSGFIEELRALLASSNFPPHQLELEVTESHIMKNPEFAIKLLQKIKRLGITIAVDDFGTGYSSLSYLKKLPIDKLKIDRSFIVDIPKDSEDIAIVKAIIALAKSLKLDIIAEGVETVAQQEFLISEGCVEIQGYLFSKPLSFDDFAAFLQANKAAS